MSKCATCPVAGACWADVPHRARLCELVAAGRADYRSLVVARSLGVEHTSVIAAVPRVLIPAYDQATLAAVSECACRHKPHGCCGPVLCVGGRHDGEQVTFETCAACVEES